MLSSLSVVFDLEHALLIGIVTSFVLGALLLLIKIPVSDYARNLSCAKNTIALCLFICSALMFLTSRFADIENYERFVSLMLFIITAESSVVLSFAMINVLEEGFFDMDKYYLNLILVFIFSVLLIKSFWWTTPSKKIAMMAISGILFVIQCGIHIHIFRKVYRKCVESLSNYYDEEEDSRLRRIKFCYVIMMWTQMFILVYLILPSKFMLIWILWYSLFFLYFTANFLSFVGSHKIMLDAFAYKTFTGVNLENIKIKGKSIIQSPKRKAEQEKAKSENTIDFRNLEQALEKWVEQKKFSEYDKSREDVTKELGTTREHLHMYFTTVKGIDFKTWRTGLRIEEAKRLLLENKELSTNVIGEIAGFSDRSNFYRQFVKIVGCSPKQWRDSNGNI